MIKQAVAGLVLGLAVLPGAFNAQDALPPARAAATDATGLAPTPRFPDDVVLADGAVWIAAAGRSPLGGPSESRPGPPRKLGEVATIRGPRRWGTATKLGPALAEGVVPWDQAHGYVGRYITVEGRAVNTHRSRSNVVFLNFDRDWRGKFYVPVFRSAHAAMPEAAEVFFLNQVVRVTGKVELYRGTPNIAVNDLGQIQVVR